MNKILLFGLLPLIFALLIIGFFKQPYCSITGVTPASSCKCMGIEIDATKNRTNANVDGEPYLTRCLGINMGNISEKL